MNKKGFDNPDSAEREYTRALLKYSAQLKAFSRQKLEPRIASLKAEFDAEVRTDGLSDALAEILLELAELATRASAPLITTLMDRFSVVSSYNERQFRMVVKANTGVDLPPVMPGARKTAFLGVDVFRSEPFLEPLADAWVRTNTDLIKSLPTRLYPELEGIVRRGVTAGESVAQMKAAIQKQYGVTDYRATLIAQDQTLTLNAQLTQYRLESIGVKKYTWRTVMDSRVRPDHADRNGKVYAFDKPPSGGKNPGMEVRCRCRAEPVWDDQESAVPAQAPAAVRGPKAPVTPPIGTAGAGIPWEPSMSPAQADKWASESVLKEPLTHYTSATAAQAIRKEGFHLKEFGQGAGDVFAKGVYTFPSSERATAQFYAKEIGGTPLTLRANVRKVHEVTLERVSMGKAVSGGKPVTEFSKLNVDQVKASVLHGIPGAAKKLEKAIQATLKSGFGGGMYPDVDAAVAKVLKDEGFDAVKILNPEFNEAIGGTQVIVLDPKRITVVK